jgi:hypothetical protein
VLLSSIDANIILRHANTMPSFSLCFIMIIGANVPRSFENEDTCIYSTLSTACSPSRELGEVLIEMNETSIPAFYEHGDKYVYAIRGLAMENLDEHACIEPKSRWEVEPNTTCSSPTPLNSITIAALQGAILGSTDPNVLLKDIDKPLECDPTDVALETLGLQIQVEADCYTHVHKDYKNVYDFSGWVRIICHAARVMCHDLSIHMLTFYNLCSPLLNRLIIILEESTISRNGHRDGMTPKVSVS